MAGSWLLQEPDDRMLVHVSSRTNPSIILVQMANVSVVSNTVVMLGCDSCRTLLSNVEPMVGQAKMTIQDKLHMRLT